MDKILQLEYSLEEFLKFLGEDPDREGLILTPKRFIKAYIEMTQGYGMDPRDVLSTTFKDLSIEKQMIRLDGIRFSSLCEHHLLPFTGTVSIGYIPGNSVVGISKLARLVDVYSKRLQIQERMTFQIAQAMQDFLLPDGCGVIVKAKHSCIGCRGAKQPDAEMTTTSLRGTFLQVSVKQEFLKLA